MQKKRSIQKNTQISFTCVDKGETLKDVLSLDASKACQVSVIPSRVIKENVDILTDFLHSSFIIQFISLNFHQSLNGKISLLFLKRVVEILGKIIDQSA